MLSRRATFIFLLFATSISAATVEASVEQLVAQYGLTTSTSLPFPAATQNAASAQALMVSEWSLGKGRIQDGPDNLAFVNDPFPDKPPAIPSSSNETGPVLQTTYPAGSFSHDTGGSQWYNLWNTTDGSTFGTMMVSYEVAFDAGFDWVKGGKLPGLRGGLNSTGCSGGNEATGLDCFSTRLMWRKNGAGEGVSVFFATFAILIFNHTQFMPISRHPMDCAMRRISTVTRISESASLEVPSVSSVASMFVHATSVARFYKSLLIERVDGTVSHFSFA